MMAGLMALLIVAGTVAGYVVGHAAGRWREIQWIPFCACGDMARRVGASNDLVHHEACRCQPAREILPWGEDL